MVLRQEHIPNAQRVGSFLQVVHDGRVAVPSCVARADLAAVHRVRGDAFFVNESVDLGVLCKYESWERESTSLHGFEVGMGIGEHSAVGLELLIFGYHIFVKKSFFVLCEGRVEDPWDIAMHAAYFVQLFPCPLRHKRLSNRWNVLSCWGRHDGGRPVHLSRSCTHSKDDDCEYV